MIPLKYSSAVYSHLHTYLNVILEFNITMLSIGHQIVAVMIVLCSIKLSGIDKMMRSITLQC